MKTTKELEIEIRNKKMIAEYEKRLLKAPVNKTKFAEEFDTSLRTLNRVLDDVGLKQAKHVPASTKTKLTPEPEVVETANVEKQKVQSNITVETEVETRELSNSDTEMTPTKEPVKTTGVVVEAAQIISWTVDKKRFISVLLDDGETISVQHSHENYDEIIHHLAVADYDAALEKMSLKHKMKSLCLGGFVVSEHVLIFNGSVVKNDIVEDVVDMFNRDEPIEHMLRFYENLMMTPSHHIFTHLWKLIKHAGVTITPEGNVECYKRVNLDFTDCYSGKIPNNIGDTVTMRRSEVNADYKQTCSHGLHVCAKQYLQSSGYGSSGIIVKVVVRPQDFVAIPPDYQFTKARTCSYKVIGLAED